ncbi:hypothetical protein L2E82_51440 [Cichorium intybus]|nr:hypothetical protein L2E82_51440 [Cichorium intybus]
METPKFHLRPLLPATATMETFDSTLLKFLRARDFRVQDSLNMLINFLSSRKDFRAGSIFEVELGFKKPVEYMNGYDREG